MAPIVSAGETQKRKALEIRASGPGAGREGNAVTNRPGLSSSVFQWCPPWRHSEVSRA